MACKLHINIGGTPVSFELAGVNSIEEATNKVYEALSEIAEGNTDSSNNPIKESVLKAYNTINSMSVKSEEEVIEEKVIKPEFYQNACFYLSDANRDIISSLFGQQEIPTLRISYDNTFRYAYYSAFSNYINIYLTPEDQSNDPGVKAMKDKFIIHEIVHSILDKNFMYSNSNIESLYNDIKKLLSNSETDLIEKKYEDSYVRVKEYLASAITEQVLNKTISQKKVTELNTRIADYIKDNTTMRDQELPYYKFMESTEFEDIDKSDLVSNIKYGKLESAKVQSSLKSIFDEFEYHKGLYEKVNYDAAYGRFERSSNNDPIKFRLKLGRLQAGDLIYIPPMVYDEKSKEMIPEEDSKYNDKYLPLVYSYFDKNKNDQVLVLAVKKKNGSYTTVRIPAKNVIGFRDSVGVLKVRKINAKELENVKSRYSKDLIFSTIEKKSTGSEIVKDESLSGNMITISISKTGVKSKIDKEAMEFRFGENEVSNNSLLQSLSRNSIVSYEAKIDGKSKTIHAPLVRTLANGVELLSVKGEVYFIPFYKVKSVIVLKEDMLSEMDYDKEYADESVYENYYKNKRISHSNMVFTDNKGNFKSVPNSKYDYNQIFNNQKENRQSIDAALLEAYKEIYKEGNDLDLKGYINSLPDSDIKDVLSVYLNRKELLKTLKTSNTYVIYDYLDQNNKKWSAKGKLVHVSNDLLYVYTETKDGGFIQRINIRDANPSRYNPSLRRILYDNSSEYNIAEAFVNQKKAIRENFNQLTELFSSSKKVGDLKSKLKKIEDSNTSTLSIEGKIPVNLSDYYYYEYFNEDLGTNTDNYKAFLLSKITPGSIVFRKKDGYINAVMVTSIDENTGDIIVADIISKASGKKAYMNGNMIKSVLDPTEVEYIGYNIYDNKELGIEANPHFKKKYEVYTRKISEFNQYKSFDSKEIAEKVIDKWKNKSKISSIPLLKVKSLKTNIEFYVPKKDINKYSDKSKFEISESDVKFGIEISYDGGSFALRNKSNYYDIDIDSSNGEKAFNLLKEGDIITMGAKTNNWYDMIVTNVIIAKDGSRKYKVESFYTDSDGVTKNIFKTITYRNKADIRKMYFDKFDKNRIESNKDVFDYSSGNAHKKEYVKASKHSRKRYSKNTSGYNKSVDNFIYIEAMTERLAKLYNVDFKLLTTPEIVSMYDNYGRSFSDKRAFVIGNEIVINSDRSSIAEPLHELTHIILPLIKKMNPTEYNTILLAIRSHPDYNAVAENYPELNGFDLDEEVFCTIFGEYYAGKMRTEFSSNWNKSNRNLIQRVFDALKKIFSSIFNINSNAFRHINDKMLMNMSIEDLFRQFGDRVVSGKYANLIPAYNDTKLKKVDELIQILYSKELITKECYE